MIVRDTQLTDRESHDAVCKRVYDHMAKKPRLTYDFIKDIRDGLSLTHDQAERAVETLRKEKVLERVAFGRWRVIPHVTRKYDPVESPPAWVEGALTDDPPPKPTPETNPPATEPTPPPAKAYKPRVEMTLMARITEALRELGPLRSTEIAALLDVSTDHAAAALSTMHKHGHATRTESSHPGSGGRFYTYALSDTPYVQLTSGPKPATPKPTPQSKEQPDQTMPKPDPARPAVDPIRAMYLQSLYQRIVEETKSLNDFDRKAVAMAFGIDPEAK